MKKIGKKLVLKTQVIRELTQHGLARVAGGLAKEDPLCTYVATGCTDAGERR